MKMALLSLMTFAFMSSALGQTCPDARCPADQGDDATAILLQITDALEAKLGHTVHTVQFSDSLRNRLASHADTLGSKMTTGQSYRYFKMEAALENGTKVICDRVLAITSEVDASPTQSSIEIRFLECRF